MATSPLDDLDVRILRLLNADARKSFREIAKAVDASLSTVSNRIRKLEQEGIIAGYAPILAESRLGYEVLAAVGARFNRGRFRNVSGRIARTNGATTGYAVREDWNWTV